MLVKRGLWEVARRLGLVPGFLGTHLFIALDMCTILGLPVS